MSYDRNNVFAKILRGEMDAHAVLDEEHCFAFMDIMPQSPGHTLIVPRESAQSIFDLSAEGLGHLAAATQRVARAVRAAFKPPGLMIMQLNGTAAGQTVFHVHVHVVPRYAGERPALHARARADVAQLAHHAARIRAELDPPTGRDG